jgi:hypothetical protein
VSEEVDLGQAVSRLLELSSTTCGFSRNDVVLRSGYLPQAFHNINKVMAHTKTQPQNIQRSFIGWFSYGARQHLDNKERGPRSTFAVAEQLNASANSGVLRSTPFTRNLLSGCVFASTRWTAAADVMCPAHPRAYEMKNSSSLDLVRI